MIHESIITMELTIKVLLMQFIQRRGLDVLCDHTEPDQEAEEDDDDSDKDDSGAIERACRIWFLLFLLLRTFLRFLDLIKDRIIIWVAFKLHRLQSLCHHPTTWMPKSS